MAALKLKQRRISGAGGAIVVLPEGDLVAGSCPQFERYLDEVFRSRVRGVAIDLSKVTFLSSAAMGVLIECVERVKEGHGWFGLVRATEQVRSSIEVLGLAEYFHLSPTIEVLLTRFGLAPRKRPESPKSVTRTLKRRRRAGK